MIKVEELRIGNLVYRNTEDFTPIDKKVIEWPESIWYRIGDCLEYNEWFEPIPLTEDWLVKLGGRLIGEGKNGGNRYSFKSTGIDWGFVIEPSFEKGKWFFGHEYWDARDEADNHKPHWCCYDLEYVHTFQNIMHSLTNQELTL